MDNSGFWSYVHADDDAEQGRIRELAHDLGTQYGAITGQSIDVNLDRKLLGWGDDWDNQINTAIVATAFFVPVVTPRYLTSEACRRELRLFAQKAEGLGYKNLIMPLLWISIPEWDEPEPTDDLVALIKRFQVEDWRVLRFEDRTSKEYRMAVADMATRLAEVSRRMTEEGKGLPPVPAAAPGGAFPGAPEPSLDGEADDDEPGTLDVMATAIDAFEPWTTTVHGVGQEIRAITALSQAAAEEMREGDRRGSALATRLAVAKRFSRDLEPRAQALAELSNDFTSHMYTVDSGIRIFIKQGAEEAKTEGGETLATVCRFFASVTDMAAKSREGLAGLQVMVDSIAPVEKMSRDMRLPLRKVRKALTVMIEGQEVIDSWARLVDEVGLDCSGQPTS